MATTETRRYYELTDTSTSTVNEDVLKHELTSAGLPCTAVERTGTSFVCVFSDNLDDTEVGTVDSTVAAHDGADFASIPAQTIVQAQATDDTGDEVERGVLNVAPMPAGSYTLIWYMQIRCDSAGGQADGRIVANINGGADIEVDTGVERSGDWFTISGSAPVDTDDGDSYRVAAIYQRAGTAGNLAYVRRVRLFMARRL